MRLLHEKTFDWQRPVLTEEKCHELLGANPLNSTVTFLSVPWATIIDQIEHGEAKSKKKAKSVLEDISKYDVQGGFSVCQHDRFHTIIPTLKKAGISTLFAPHMASPEGYTTKGFYFKPNKEDLSKKISERASNHSGLYIDGIQIETIPLWPVFIGDPTIKKDVWYSYIGSYGPKHISDVRKKIMDDDHPLDCISVARKGWQFDMDVYQEQIFANTTSGFQKYVNRKKSEFYQKALSRSRFALCPSGTGPAVIRLLEALGSGAIPVILSDAMMLPTLSGVNWEDCCVKIPEKDYNTLRDTLSNITPDREEEMRKKCLEYYKLTSGDNYVRSIREYYDGSL
mgnify:CR=1 FL=1